MLLSDREPMRLFWTVLRVVLALAFVGVAGVCIVRGMRDLFWGPSARAASFDGVTAAILYFVAGVLALLLAGELSPKGSVRRDAPRR